MRITEAEYHHLLALSGQPLPDNVAEARFQAQVVRLARELGYRTFAVYNSRRSPQGWFDLAMARAGDKLVLAELKSARGKQTAEQRDWYEDLQRIERVETYLWRPADWAAIVEILQARSRT